MQAANVSKNRNNIKEDISNHVLQISRFFNNTPTSGGVCVCVCVSNGGISNDGGKLCVSEGGEIGTLWEYAIL